MRECNLNKIIFSSTCATYGIPNINPITEEHPQNPISPYGESKLIIEKILKNYDKAYGFRSISLRYFNAAGADPDGEIGEFHEPETHLIPIILESVINKKFNIFINGNDYDTPDGTCVRDYIHVSDLANAHVLALKELILGANTQFYNLGNGKGFSVKEVIEASEKATKTKIPYKITNRRAGDPPYLVGNSNLINIRLGWKPIFSDLEKIIFTAWQWHSKNSKSF